MAISQAAPASGPAPSPGGMDMPTLRIRTERLDSLLHDAGFEHAEQLVRKAEISRSAWHNLKSGRGKEVNLRVLANVMGALKVRDLNQLVEFIPDEPPRGRS